MPCFCGEAHFQHAFPTDAKLAKKVIDACNRIAQFEQVKQRQSYVRVSKQLLREAYNATHPRRAKKARKARKKLRTIAGRLIRELERELPAAVRSHYQEDLQLYRRVISQKRKDKDKIYSLHKSFTACIVKGKAGRSYEFGNKVGLLVHATRAIVTVVKSFAGNPHDSKTIEPLLEVLTDTGQPLPKEVIYDRGGRGQKMIGGVKIITPTKPQNARLAATGWNMKKWMERVTRSGRAFCRLLEKWVAQIFLIPLKLIS